MSRNRDGMNNVKRSARAGGNIYIAIIAPSSDAVRAATKSAAQEMSDDGTGKVNKGCMVE